MPSGMTIAKRCPQTQNRIPLMKRSVLFVGNVNPLHEEIQDSVLARQAHACFSITAEQSIRALDSHPINLVMLTLHQLEELNSFI